MDITIIGAQMSAWIVNNLQYILLGMTGLIFLALLVFIDISIKLSKLNRRYEKMMRGMEEGNLEELLMKNIDNIRRAVTKVDCLEQDCRGLRSAVKNCIQKVSMLRYNAFQDTGSDLSYSIALLDEKNDGVIVTSIFGRDETRTYAKPVRDGQSSYVLTKEETKVLDDARGK